MKPPLKTPKKKRGQTTTTTPVKKPQAPPTVKQEVAELRAENATLNNAMKLLQETVVRQGILITDLSAKIDVISQDNRKDFDEKLGSLETRIVNFYTDQDKQCSIKKKQVTSAFNLRMDKISNKLDNALRSFTTTIKEAPATLPLTGVPPLNNIQTKMNNMQSEIEKVEHEMAKMQDSIDKLATDSSSFTPVKPPKSHPHLTNNTDGGLVDGRLGKSNTSAPTAKHANDSFDQDGQRKSTTRKMYKSILFMDSNRKFLVQDQLWKNNTVIPCGNTYDLRKIINTTNMEGIDLIFIHTGVNDIDRDNGSTVSKNLVDIVDKLRAKHPNLKVVVSEITPRQFTKDNEVQTCNTALHTALDGLDNVTIAKHSNLRNEHWSFHVKKDDRHFDKVSIGRLAKNLKIAFRKAIGLPVFEKRKGSGGGKAPTKHTSQNGLGNEDNVETFKQKLMSFLKSC